MPILRRCASYKKSLQLQLLLLLLLQPLLLSRGIHADQEAAERRQGSGREETLSLKPQPHGLPCLQVSNHMGHPGLCVADGRQSVLVLYATSFNYQTDWREVIGRGGRRRPQEAVGAAEGSGESAGSDVVGVALVVNDT